MAAASILKIRKIAISPQQNDRLWQNVVQWYVFALQIPWANKNSRFRKSKMATAAILKNGKMLISSQPFNWFWQNLACWCASTLFSPIAKKNSRSQKSQMAATAILKIRKIATSQQWNDQFWQNLVKWYVWANRPMSANKILWIRQSKMATATVLNYQKIFRSRNQLIDFDVDLCVSTLSTKFRYFKNPRWRRPFWKFNKCNVSTTKRPILKTFSMMMNLGLPDTVCQWNFTNLKIQDGSPRPFFEKLKNLNIFNRFCQNLTCSRVLILWTTLAKKFGDFKNKRWWWQPFGKSKNRNIYALDGPVLKKNLAWWCVLFLPTASAYKMLRF